MQQVRAKKALGQHFLTDLSIAERIAGTVSDFKGLPVLEVGPGMGVLTQFLLAQGHDLKVVELDGESVNYLQAAFPRLEGRIIAADFLRLDLDQVMGPGQWVVIGNYPYNISSQIFFKVLDYKDRVSCCSGMLQREVAQRIAAGPGSKTYGILSVLLQAWYDIEFLFTVGPGAFNPPPKVQSAVIRLRRNGRTSLPCDEALFKTVVKTAFNQRRKTLRNSLKPLIADKASREQWDAETLSAFVSRPVFDLRPERLGVEEFVDLTLSLA